MWYNKDKVTVLPKTVYYQKIEVIRLSDAPAKKPRSFFHADTKVYSDALRHALIVVIIPVLAICIFCTVNIVLYFNTDFAKLMMFIIGGSVLFGMIFSFSAVYITDKRKRRHARFTFFDILPQGMVFSEYAGEFIRYGELIILRRLYYIPFEGFESVSRDPKKTPRELTIKGSIRGFFFESDRLGYHVNESGEMVFDTDILNIGMYDEPGEVIIKKRFGKTRSLEAAILFYKEQFDNAPEKKPFNISDYVAIRRKPKPKTSNPALEAPSYSRDWK